MPKKQTSLKNKTKVSNNQSSTNFLIVMVILLIVGVLGYFGIKNYTNLLDNKSSQAETPKSESYSTIWDHVASTTFLACKFHSSGRWRMRVQGFLYTSSPREVGVWKRTNPAKIGRYDSWGGRTEEYIYGTAKTGYVEFILSSGSTEYYSRLMRYKNLSNCS